MYSVNAKAHTTANKLERKKCQITEFKSAPGDKMHIIAHIILCLKHCETNIYRTNTSRHLVQQIFYDSCLNISGIKCYILSKEPATVLYSCRKYCNKLLQVLLLILPKALSWRSYLFVTSPKTELKRDFEHLFVKKLYKFLTPNFISSATQMANVS